MQTPTTVLTLAQWAKAHDKVKLLKEYKKCKSCRGQGWFLSYCEGVGYYSHECTKCEGTGVRRLKQFRAAYMEQHEQDLAKWESWHRRKNA